MASPEAWQAAQSARAGQFTTSQSQQGGATQTQRWHSASLKPGATPRALEPPVLSVPKAGGAISSLGEKFDVSPSLGTCSFSIPLPMTSSARSNIVPDLALNYNSGSGNGPFGYGWSLGIGAITRKTENGIPQYRDDDVFVLSGTEDLVPVLKRDANTSKWVEAGAMPASANGVKYQVRRFCPRTEGSFASIEQWTPNVTGSSGSYWRVLSASNETSFYGLTTDSRIYDPADPSRIFSWLLCEVRDSAGNRVVINYKREDSAGLDLTSLPLNERNRTEVSRTANLYPKSIKYGNRVSTLSTRKRNPDERESPWFFEVVLDYGEHDIVQPSPGDTGEWLMRLDPFSTYRSGFEIRSYRLCQRVLLFHHFPGEQGVGRNCLVKSVDLSYIGDGVVSSASPAGGRRVTLLDRVEVSSYKRSGSGASGYGKKISPPIQFGYSRGVQSLDVRDLDPLDLEDMPMPGSNFQYVFTDLYGDGIPGILFEANAPQVDSSTWMYKRGLGRGKYAVAEYLKNTPYGSLIADDAAGGSGISRLLDINGDGLPEMVRLQGNFTGFSRTKTFEPTGNPPTPPLSDISSLSDSEGPWEPFVEFESAPQIDWVSPHVRFVDLTGDGVPDVLCDDEDGFRWYSGAEEKGFVLGRNEVMLPHDEEDGPRHVLTDTDTKTALFLADMTGDGLSDIVRVRNHDVCYWPNMGYGRFGAKMAMDGLTSFDYEDTWDPSRLRLADIDGTGTTDIIYFGSGDAGGVAAYYNESGNSFSTPLAINSLPAVSNDNMQDIQIADVLGTGTACIAYLTSQSGRRSFQYLDVNGGVKPFLLTSVANNLGSETSIEYTSSAWFCSDDRLAGKPWHTALPFPIHVVSRVTHADRVGRTYFSSRYAYHHGYFDGTARQREVRGFALVEQWDTESFDVLRPDAATTLASDGVGDGAANLTDGASHVPPVHTKTWFHVGAWLGSRGGIDSRFLTGEYWQGPLLPPTVLPGAVSSVDGTPTSHNLSAPEIRDACRALRGSVLRTEVYALDGSDKSANPYIISERRFAVDLMQPGLEGETFAPAIFMPRSIESVTIDLDRAVSFEDARIRHQVALETDYFGNTIRSVDVVYGRRSRFQGDTDQSPNDKLWQQQSFAVLEQCAYTNSVGMDLDVVPSARQLPQAFDEQVSQLHNIERPASGLLFSTDSLKTIVESSLLAPELPFSDVVGSSKPRSSILRRPLARSKTEFRSDDLLSVLPFGTIESLAIISRSYAQLATDELLQKVFVDEALLTAADLQSKLSSNGKALRLSGTPGWWVPSSQAFFAPDGEASELTFARENFFLPHRFVNPFDTDAHRDSARVRYDQYCLLPLETEDSLSNRISAGVRDLGQDSQPLVQSSIDYRVMEPTTVMDANGNMAKIAHDIYGIATVTAIMGKPDMSDPNFDSAEGDSISNVPADADDSIVSDFFSDPTKPGVAHALLGAASSRVVYDQLRYFHSMNPSLPQPRTPQPGVVATISREVHASDGNGLPPPLQIVFSYSDGLSRTIQTKRWTDDGPIDGNGTSSVASPRWITTGWTIFDNKGNQIQKYELFFTPTHGFEFASTKGVTTTTFYDPLSRAVAVLNPDHSWSKVIVSSWSHESWDANDTTGISDPRLDPDVGEFFSRLSKSGGVPGSPSPLFWPTWAAQRLSGDLGLDEQRAAQNTLVHAGTPGVSHTDASGRVFVTSSLNKTQRSDGVLETEQLVVRQHTDIQGNPTKIVNANGSTVQTAVFDMAGRPLKVWNMDNGCRWGLPAIDGQPIAAWNDHGDRFESRYDIARRPTETLLFQGSASTGQVFMRVEYGESVDHPEARNLRGQTAQVYDQAGIAVSEVFDFKGNPTKLYRQLSKEYKAIIDWSATPGPALLQTKYRAESKFDALNRATEVSLYGSTTVKPTYSRAGNIVNISARLGSGAPFKDYVTDAKHNARGQRLQISYGNGTTTTCSYDPLTFRVRNITSIRNRGAFPGDDPNPPQPNWSGKYVQNLSYVYDPAGNICSVLDAAQQRIHFDGARVEASQAFIYDALYRLVEATGREHQSAGYDAFDAMMNHLQHPNNGLAMRRYTETYAYDKASNILSLRHASGGSGGFTRRYHYNEASSIDSSQNCNRLSSVTRGNLIEAYTYDAHGNMASIAHLSLVQWDFADRLKATAKGNVAADSGNVPETTYYTYGASGERGRKVTENFATAGATPTIKSQRIYVGGIEIYEEFPSGVTSIDDSQPRSKRTMLVKLVDGGKRLALIDKDLDSGETSTRYQLTNHLGSVSIELDDASNVASYEEYSPFGSTSYQGLAQLDLPRQRQRYNGKERDEESGLYYNSARYYLPWIGRWASCDKGGLQDGLNLYAYCHNNPVVLTDPGGGKAQAIENGIVTYPLHPKEKFKGESFPEAQRTSRETVVRQANKEGIGVAGAMHWRKNIAVFEHVWKITAEHPADDPNVGFDADEVITVTATPPPDNEDGGGGTGAGTSTAPSPAAAATGPPADGSGKGPEGPKPDSGAPWWLPAAGTVGSNVKGLWDAVQRSIYQAAVKRASRVAQAAVDAAVAAENFVEATEFAKAVSTFRNESREGARRWMFKVGKKFSQWADETKGWEELARKYSFNDVERELLKDAKYAERMAGVAPAVEAGTWAKDIAAAAGRSRGGFLIKAAKWGGPAMLAVGAAGAIWTVADAPPGQQARVAAHEGGALVGGLVGSIAADVLLVGFVVGTGGWAVVVAFAIAAVGGIAGTWLGGMLGDSFASWKGW
ncbi:insecticidal toxin complex protein [Fusarium solani]|uniref:Insecticidal toxin complex protein n=1 Tax=Fusarium solani TaxID=169388 RepID=A0A9P9K0U9_FUSSL|nr:insecticidal toxin complex protein [Fusarium solani]KAH7244003.1 insecticidal toxin complex protein [Fusarium solani]